MNNTILVALIAVAGVIFGAILTALASAFTARQKIKEIQLTYLQKLREDYLANARNYTQGIYVPLNMLLSKLLTAYDEFRVYIDFSTETVEKDYESKFRLACEEYQIEISKLLQDKGANAFLTTELEEQLRSFNTFIKVSLTVNKPKFKVVLRSSIPLFSTDYTTVIEGKLAKFVKPISAVKFNYWGFGFSYLRQAVLAAPITSRDFEQQILDDERAIRILIKEVTLGAHATSNKNE